MADELSDSAPDSPNKWRHDWYPYQDYLNVHRSYMDRLLDEHIVVREHLTFTEALAANSPALIFIEGFLECADDLLVFVNKHLESRLGRRRRLEVRGFNYNYHALLGGSQRDLLRYDNAHGEFHRHVFDVKTGREARLDVIGRDEMPTLDAMVRAAHQLALDAARSHS